MIPSAFLWLIFGGTIITMLSIDLWVFSRRERAVTMKEAVFWSILWIALALLFNLGFYFTNGHDDALKFLTGYLIEKSLSVDNLFVFLMIFTYFKVPARYQHKVLFWGILGALVMRALFISAGVTLIQTLQWSIYVFGVFLVFTGIKVGLQRDQEVHPERNIFLRIFRRFFPVTPEYQEDRFFVRQAGRWLATPLFVTLIVIETTDIVFATDSIPAILGITVDPFIVYSSNIFAILGLRALYFVLAGLMRLFRYLHYGLSVVLVFIGAKMILQAWYHIPTGIALGVVGGILFTSILVSLLRKEESSSSPDR